MSLQPKPSTPGTREQKPILNLRRNGFIPANVINSFRILSGNTKVSVLFEPLWGLGFALYHFYLGLYLQTLGITGTQMGYLISIGSVASIVFSFFSGPITDVLGRKKTTLIFDLICWPCSILIYLFSGNFYLFALATIANSMTKITSVSWNLMVVEDATAEQQVAAYNLVHLINLSMGIFTPVAGVFVKYLGVVTGERLLMAFAAALMTAMILCRNHNYKETRIGQEILADHQSFNLKKIFDLDLYSRTLKRIKEKPQIGWVLAVAILFNSYIPIGAYTSLYYGPYLSETLSLDKSAISLLGGLNSLILLFMLMFIVPGIRDERRIPLLISGIFSQILSLFLFVIMPAGSFLLTALAVIVFAVGFALTRTYIDSLLAAVSGGRERAGIYAFSNTFISLFGALLGLLSGFLFSRKPSLIYVLSIFLLLLCAGILIIYELEERKTKASQKG